VVGLNVGQEQEKGFFVVGAAGVQECECVVGDSVGTVAGKRALLPVGVEEVAAHAVRREFEDVGSDPPAVITAAQFRRDGLCFVIGLASGGRQVPFAHVGDIVTGCAQPPGQGRDPLGQGDAVAKTTGSGRNQAGLQHSPGRTADRLVGVGVLEVYPGARQGVQCRGHRQGLAVAAECVVTLLVGKIDQDVGTRVFHPILFSAGSG